MFNKKIGKKNWIIPDCELPQEGEGVLKGHESVIVVNDNDFDVKIKVTLYFADKDCYSNINWVVGAKRVRCFRMNNVDDMDSDSAEKHKNDFYEAYRTPDNYGETIKRKKQ